MPKSRWGKTLTAVVTPMEGNEVNYELAETLCRDIIDHGCDGVVVGGTTGEAATLTVLEKLHLFERISIALGDKGVVIAGVGSNNTQDTVELIQRAETLPLDGYMVITPYYNKPNISGLREHFAAVDAASTRPIMLYNVPSRTGIDMSLADYETILGSCGKISAVKEASGDLVKASWLTSTFAGVEFFSGNDDLTLPLLALGFSGVVSVAANVVPGPMAQITELARAGDWEGARAVHNALLPLFQALFMETNPVPVKAALKLQGWSVGKPRLPLGELSLSNNAKLAGLINKYKRERS